MKMMAQPAVILERTVTEPRPPKTVFEEPPPPPNAAMPSAFPGCIRITKMRKTLTMTCSAMVKAYMASADSTQKPTAASLCRF